jgi:hypothetical protein
MTFAPAKLTTEQRLEKLEGEIRDLRAEEQKLRSDVGADAKTKGAFVRGSGKENAIRVGGLMHPDRCPGRSCGGVKPWRRENGRISEFACPGPNAASRSSALHNAGLRLLEGRAPRARLDTANAPSMIVV